MTTLSVQSTPAKKVEVAFQSMPPETILLNLDSGYYYSTNQIGATIWERCDGKTSIVDMAKALAKTYEVDVKEVEQDIFELVQDMVKEGLLEI